MDILIVEDDLTGRLILQRFLKELGNIDIAENGAKALELIDQKLQSGNNYELICLDIKMQGISGIEVLHRLREKEREKEVRWESKVLMTTTASDKKVIEISMREQCNGYLLKPFDKETLFNHLRKFDFID